MLQDRAAIAERAVGQSRPQPPHRPQIAVFGIGRQPPLEKMYAQVVFAFALGVPQDRGFDRLNFGRIDGVDLIFADQFVAGGKVALSGRQCTDSAAARSRAELPRPPAAPAASRSCSRDVAADFWPASLVSPG